MKIDDWKIGWRRIEVAEVKGQGWGIVPCEAWQGVGEFEWQIVHRYRSHSESQTTRAFELTCDEPTNLGGWFSTFGSFEEARAEAERFERRARSRRRRLGTPCTRGVVLWPDNWEILGSSEEIANEWACPYCRSHLPAYKVETDSGQHPSWICSSCSMPLEWRDSPDRFRFSGNELDRLEAEELEREWGFSCCVVDDRHFFLDDPIEGSAVHALRRVWLPAYLTSRTVLCCEEETDGALRWVCFVTEEERLAILIEADETKETYLGHYVDFGSLSGMLDLAEAWDPGSGWVDQLPDPQVFWLQQGQVRPDSGIDVVAISELLNSPGSGDKA